MFKNIDRDLEATNIFSGLVGSDTAEASQLSQTTQIINMKRTKTAYHEAGHISFHYVFGYECKWVKLHPKRHGSGQTKLLHGADERLCKILTAGPSSYAKYNKLSEIEQERTFIVASRLIMTLMAGPVAEALVGPQSLPTSLKVGIQADKGADGDHIKTIEQFLSTFYESVPPATNLLEPVACMLKEYLWPFVQDIASALLEQGELSGESIAKLATRYSLKEIQKLLEVD